MDINILIILRGMYKAITVDNSDCWQLLTLDVITLAKYQVKYNNFLLIQTKRITTQEALDVFKVRAPKYPSDLQARPHPEAGRVAHLKYNNHMQMTSCLGKLWGNCALHHLSDFNTHTV